MSEDSDSNTAATCLQLFFTGQLQTPSILKKLALFEAEWLLGVATKFSLMVCWYGLEIDP